MGKKLAQRLNMEFADLDEVIEKMVTKSIPEFYAEVGDTEFRKYEWKALKEVIKKENIIVSTGGGAPCHCDNMSLMEQNGDVLYIHLDNDTLVSRLKHATKDRPIVLNKTDEELREYIADLRNRCEHHYTRAKYVVEGKDITVERILNALNIQTEPGKTIN
jgi:shikimate kinase